VVGLIALDRDVVIEGDLHRLIESRAEMVTTRIPLAEVGSAERLAELESHVPAASRLLGPAVPDVVVFGCTSGVALVGRERIEEAIHEVLPGAEVVDPLSAMAENMRGRGIERLALVTPFRPDVAEVLTGRLERVGFGIAAHVRIESDANRYAEIPVGVIAATATRAGRVSADAVVIACTGLRAVEAMEEVEAHTRLPVVTSNQALAWAVLEALTRRRSGSGAWTDG
jgi:maleate isomerase